LLDDFIFLLYKENMRAAVLKEIKKPLVLQDVPIPIPGDGEILARVEACGICRTDLHIQDGDLPHPKLPLILGHEIVGIVESVGKNVSRFKVNDRVGIPWLAKSCGDCRFCLDKRENLCDHAEYTGYNRNGGFAEYTTCRADFAISLPKQLSSDQLAPFLCAGLIGYRSYRKAAPKKNLGVYGFGASAHLVTQIAIKEGKDVFAFTREGDISSQKFARELGAIWSGNSSQMPPVLLDAAIIFAPVGSLVPLSLKALEKGGKCICGGIHMSDIPSFPYELLWGERSIESIANLTRQDAIDFFSMLSQVSVKSHVTSFSLDNVNQALDDLRQGKIEGAAVLKM
jgi:alcohol dehydrogenase, propanol-preferring